MTSDTNELHCPRRVDELSPDPIEQRLERLIRNHLRTRFSAIAVSVVRHIETLCSHLGLDGDTSERCAHLRLRAHWRWFAHGAPSGRGA